MNTPTFECSQNNSHIIIKIRVPYVTISEVEYVVNGNVFRFYAKPYFLRLTFPHPLDSSGKTDSTSYDSDNHIFKVLVGKIKTDLFYPNLNMLTTLLQKPKSKHPTKPLIEVLSSELSEGLKIGISPSETFEWEQTVVNPENSLQDEPISTGFNGEYEKVFENNIELKSMVDVPNPDHSTPREKHELMLSDLKKEFMSDHVIFDLLNFQSEAKKRIDYVPFYIRQINDPEFEKKFGWLENEKRIMTSLPRKEYLISNFKRVWIGFLDILVSFCYDERINLGQENSESSWNIRKLCSSFSWLMEYISFHAFCSCFVLRVLTYPLIRNFDLAVQCLRDAVKIMERKEMCLRCFLKIFHMFRMSPDYPIFSKVFLQDYCIWMQRAPNEHFGKVRGMLMKSIEILLKNKYEVTKILCLKDIEEYAKEEIEEKRKNESLSLE